jgi:hypothetical protein
MLFRYFESKLIQQTLITSKVKLNEKLENASCHSVHNLFGIVYHLKHIDYKTQKHKFTSCSLRLFTDIFQWLNPSGRIVALVSTQSVTEMSTRNPSWG